MNMTELKCTVKNCVHNSDECCCKQAIIVDGREAEESHETCCGSFDENEGGFFQNIFKTPENKLEIDCEAKNCIYNEDRHCKANQIGIVGNGAREAYQTECESFEMK